MQQKLEEQLNQLPPDENSSTQRQRIFKSVVGEDKYGHVKTFGLGYKNSRSVHKRAYEVERNKRIDCERKLQRMEDILKFLVHKQGLTFDDCLLHAANEAQSDEEEKSDEEAQTDEVAQNVEVAQPDGADIHNSDTHNDELHGDPSENDK